MRDVVFGKSSIGKSNTLVVIVIRSPLPVSPLAVVVLIACSFVMWMGVVAVPMRVEEDCLRMVQVR